MCKFSNARYVDSNVVSDFSEEMDNSQFYEYDDEEDFFGSGDGGLYRYDPGKEL